VHPALPILLMGAFVALIGEGPEPVAPPRERIVLLPEADGSTGAVTVTTAAGETVLDRPYAAADVFDHGRVQRAEDNAQAVLERFGPALAARPPAPVSFTVYFVFDREELTPESAQLLARIKETVAGRPPPEIVVKRPTQRVGRGA
jgi:hypothetical protein